MLGENIKNIRKAKGLSQEELAIKLNVVRQTVSKWEKGLSVPDSELLIRIAEELETPVNVLLDESQQSCGESELKILASKLEIINQQMAKQSENRRKIWRVFSITACVVAVCVLLGCLVRYISMQSLSSAIGESTAIIGGSDSPTAILVSNKTVRTVPILLSLAVLILAIAGICKTRKD